MARMVRFFVLAITIVCLLTSCTVFKDLFLNANKIGSEFVTAFDYLLKNIELVPISDMRKDGFEEYSTEQREIDPVLTSFMNTYVHLATGISKTSDAYSMLENVMAYMTLYFDGATFMSAEKIDIPNITVSERFISPVWCGNHPTYVSKGVLVKMRVSVNYPGWDADQIIAWPLMIIDDKPYMITIYEADVPSGDAYYPFYPIPFFMLD
jgi:hypothetical protein